MRQYLPIFLGHIKGGDDRVYKISKDIAQINKIYGEMIGISKI